MAPTVRISRGSAARLTELQRKLKRLGHHFTKGQILEYALDLATPGDLVGRSLGADRPVRDPDKVMRAVLESAEDMGPTSWRDIDPLVYGRKRD